MPSVERMPAWRPPTDEPVFPEWGIELGRRVAEVRSRVPTVDRVVLVPDAWTAVEVIAAWSLGGRWPVLIEDGHYSQLFIEAFDPAEVIRVPASDRPVPTSRAEWETAWAEAIGEAWREGGNASESDEMIEANTPEEIWQELGWTPPGVVVLIEGDSAWPAGLALAADRGQPLRIVPAEYGNRGEYLVVSEWERLRQRVEEEVAGTGLEYEGLGDEIDSVTLVGKVPSRFAPDVGAEPLALVDGLGRSEEGNRWAITGWISGGSERSLFQAMSAIFLHQERGVLYNTYSEPQREVYGLEAVGGLWESVGVEMVDGSFGGASLGRWRALVSEAWGYDFSFINSSGGTRSFRVGDGNASGDRSTTVADIPVLERPLAMQFIHSFSAADPGDPNTVAGRWLEEGVYVYVGSVHEPQLNGFVPPRIVTERLLRGIPFSVAARWTTAPVWRITVIGDPLMVFTPRLPRLAPEESPYLFSR